MSKKGKNGSKGYFSINEKFAHTTLKKIDQYMDELRALVGKKGDGAQGGSKTLIGAVEGLNNEARDGKDLTDAYKKFNNNTLKTFKTQVNSLDFEFNVIDRIAR